MKGLCSGFRVETSIQEGLDAGLLHLLLHNGSSHPGVRRRRGSPEPRERVPAGPGGRHSTKRTFPMVNGAED
ncbi:hypothetical protein GDO81_029846 [Engystomops pustulosus]|uniref:Uncharacterized protein n=1 Tax=Engystomops pustulosus TaxID=76066 RepID=A0AAV6YIY5_ENGPU|nr:hypothetical protein GDO81_029846 [Engystomops pustulosus]